MYKRTWWLNPAAIYGLLLLIVCAAYAIPAGSYASLYGAQKEITLAHTALYGLSFVFFFAGYRLAGRKRYNGLLVTTWIVDGFDEDVLDLRSLWRVYRLLFAVCIVAYAVWYANFIRLNGVAVLGHFTSAAALSEAMYLMRDQSGRISGLTTFTEMGMLVTPLGIYLARKAGEPGEARRIRRQLLLLVALALFRAVAFSERLALVELLVPAVVMSVALCENANRHRLVRFGPVAAMAAALLFFGIFEYSRSWLRHYQAQYDSYWQFIIQRLLGYYCNAINTECMVLHHSEPALIPYFTIAWFWELPGMAEVYNAIAPVHALESFTGILQTYGNPEFNNPGGMLTFVTDFGLLFPIFGVIFGFAVGRAYRLFCEDNVLGLILYPYLFLCLLELPRFFLPGFTRSFFVYVGLFIILWRSRRKAALA